MNYRHAFHAGNFADVMKHALVARILAHLGLKEAPYRVVDTHAGIGLYDLAGDEASRTGEWREGIGRLDEPLAPDVETVLAPYRATLAAIRDRYGPAAYPGSPLLALAAMRRGDRAILCEKHPEDVATLTEVMRRERRAKVLHLDGWTGLGALIPPPERRGLVLIDPPYEVVGELDAAASRLLAAVRRWPTGIVALWYPVKEQRPVDAMTSRVAAALDPPGLRIELAIDRPGAPGLIGSGLLVVNPPWTLAPDAALLLPALAERLGRQGRGSYRCDALAPPGP